MELGKHGKLTGQKHPRDLRKTDPVPERATPAAKPHRKVEKLFGFSYEYRSWWRKGKPWERVYEWFATERAATQAFASFVHRFGKQEWYRDIRAEKR